MSIASVRAAGKANRKKHRQVWPWRVVVQVACLATLPLLDMAPPWALTVAGVALVAGTAILGRWFCGWACPWGSALDGLRWVFEKTVLRWFPRLDFTVPLHIHKVLLKVKYVFLVGMVPLAFLMDASSIADPNSSESASINPVSVIIIIVVVLAIGLIPRAFCLYLCPIGAALAIVSLPRQLRITKPRTNCGKKCMICTVNCPMHIDLANTDTVKSEECIQCLRCVDVCPRGTAQLHLAKTSTAGK